MSEKGEDAINTILAKIGVPGKYQIFTFVCTFTIGIISAFQTVGLAFIQADVSYRCAEESANSTHLTPDSENVFNNRCFVGDNSSAATECERFIYDQSIFKSTITICSRARLVTVSNLVYNGVGIICGIFTGWLSDKIGRKPCIILHLAIIGVVGTITAFSVSMEMYIILKVIMSAPTVGLYDATNSHLSECTAPAKRPHMLIGSVISWGVAILLMSGLGYLIRDWKHLQLVISAPCLLIALLAFWGYDESPHWLYSQGKFEESQKVIEKIARWNKYDLEDFSVISGKVKHGESSQKVSTIELKDESNNASNISVEFTGEENEMTESSKHGCLQILKSGRFMLIFLICSFAWFSCNIGYYGLLYGIGDLVGDLYVNNTLGGVAEIIAYCLCFVILKGGRKYVYVGLGIIGGVSLIGSAIFTIYPTR
ncbi:hypothetical protein EB796_017410 [Bugula neritina]|uniref:Uncharacterized protein n=1 Tax=Bugula neritina TaxID=10212 RepID=A0A7J7JDB2_BUGNE|nr:hypothetical protein EB796_017410 [Bugula neritina]